jgi:hypothetical protein
VLEETSRGDLRLVEIQVKVEICCVMTCFFTSLTGGPPHFADLFFLPHAFCLSFMCSSRSFVTCPLLVEVTYSVIKKRRQQLLSWLLEEAWPLNEEEHSAILRKQRERRQRAERAAPSVRKKRDFVAESYTHFSSV